MHASVPLVPPRASGLRLLLGVLGVLAVLSMASEYTWPDDGVALWRVWLDHLAFFPLQLGSTTALLLAARRAELPEGTRRALRFIGAGFGVITFGSLVWTILSVAGHPQDYVSWVDPIYFTFYPLAIAGLLALPRVPGTDLRWRSVLSWGVVFVAFGSLVVLVLLLEELQARYSPALRTMLAVSSAGQLVTVIALSDAIERALRQPSPGALFLFFAGLALTTLGDLAYQIAYSTGYDGWNWNVPLAMLANVCMVGAAIRFLESPLVKSTEDAYPRNPFTPLPIITMSGLVLIILWLASTGRMEITPPLVTALVILNALLVVRDHMASRTAAEALLLSSQRAAARRIDALVRHSSDALVLVDGHGRLLFASAPADQLFQQPLSRHEGDDITTLVPAEEREGWITFLTRLRAAGGQTLTHTWHIARGTPEERLIETIGQDLRAEAAVGGVVLNSRDVTERATLEDRLRQAQKLEVAGRLAGGVAHDFNNVLTAVMAGTELAQIGLDPQHPVQQDLAGIEASAQRGAALTRRLLAFVRQEPVPAQRFDLREMLLELEPLLQRLVGDANQVSVRVDPTIGTVVVDRTELEHIIFNLVANARDAMGEGGSIIVDASVEQRRGDEEGDFVIRPAEGRHACISVTDRGHGMPDDVRRRMFDPFFTQKSGGRGTGLGLIGVRPLVEGAGGGLQVTSTPAEGTRVSLWLPAAVATTPRPARTSGPLRHVPAPAAPVSSARATSKGRILLVEDELSVREQLTRLLDALGYTTIPVTSAADARLTLEAETSRIDAVVSDVMMPGETGLEFAEWIRSTRPTLPILLISGHTGTALDRAARQSEELGLLRKPFAANDLDERLTAMLAR